MSSKDAKTLIPTSFLIKKAGLKFLKKVSRLGTVFLKNIIQEFLLRSETLFPAITLVLTL